MKIGKKTIRILSAVFISSIIMMSVTGCSIIDAVYGNIDLFIKDILEIDEYDDHFDSNDDYSFSNEENEYNKSPVSDIPVFQKDESYAGLTIDDVSADLISWLCATNAVQSKINGLDITVIGGMQRDDENLDWLAGGLEAGWHVTDRESLLEQVDKLTGFDGIDSDDGWDMSRAEQILAQGYCLGYLEFDEYLEYAIPLGRLIQKRFSDWDSFGDNYLKGYMNWISKGGFGFSGDIQERLDWHQYFVTCGEYYTGPYAVDFDMELTPKASAMYYDHMDPQKPYPAQNDKVPEVAQAYIAPENLGIMPTSGIVEIEGDLYHIPATVQAFLDNEWSLEENDLTFKPGTTDNEICLTRGGKSINLVCTSVARTSGRAEEALVETISASSLGDVSFILPSNIEVGMNKSECLLLLKTLNREYENTEAGIEISLAAINDYVNKSTLSISFDGKKVSDIEINCYETKSEQFESYIRNSAFNNLEKNIEKARERKNN